MSQPNETIPQSFTIGSFSADGEFLDSTQINGIDLEPEHVEFFQTRFRHLSGDLELPLEGKLPGDLEFIEYRIGSDLSGAFVLYYFHDEVIFASLLLSGNDELAETELMQVFKFLLLDTGDAEEPSEEEIESVLSSDEFDFELISDRPVAFQIELATDADEVRKIDHVRTMDRHLSAAFFGLDRSDTE
jgi:hypothetical protein